MHVKCLAPLKCKMHGTFPVNVSSSAIQLTDVSKVINLYCFPVAKNRVASLRQNLFESQCYCNYEVACANVYYVVKNLVLKRCQYTVRVKKR